MQSLIKVSWLHIQAFCEYQLYLSVCKGIGDLSTAHTDHGTALHSTIFNRPESASMPVAEDVPRALSSGQPFIAKEVELCGQRLIGRADRLEYHPTHITIIDYKPKPPTGFPFYGDRRQVFAYCLAFSEQYPAIHLPIFAEIRDHSGVKFWSSPFTPADAADVNDALDRIAGIIDGTRAPVPTSKPQKCTNCRYLRYCDKSPVRRS